MTDCYVRASNFRLNVCGRFAKRTRTILLEQVTLAYKQSFCSRKTLHHVGTESLKRWGDISVRCRNHCGP